MKNWFMNIFSGIIDLGMGRKGTDESPRLEYVKSRIDLFRPRFALVEDSLGLGRGLFRLTPDPILSRICVVSLIFMIMGIEQVWGATVTIDSWLDFTDKTNEKVLGIDSKGAAGPFTKTAEDGATFTLSGGDVRKWCSSDESNCHFYLAKDNTVTLSWEQPTGYTIAVDSIAINAFMAGSGGKLYLWPNDDSAGREINVIAKNESGNTNSAGLTKTYVYHTKYTNTKGSSVYLFPDGNKMSVSDNFKIKPTTEQGRINWIKLRYELTPISYTVTLDNESPTTEGSTSVSLTYDSNTHASITNPTMEDYTFGGWWTGDNGTGDMVIAADGTMQANVTGYTGADGVWKMAGTTTLYAKWISNAKTIMLDNQSATTAGSTSISVLYGKNNNLTGTPAITVPARTGYTFEGYYTATGGGGVQIIAANGNVNASVTGYTDEDKKWLCESDITLYAYWKQNQSITWSQPISNSVRSTVIELSASASSGETVTYTATSNSGTVSISGNILTCLTAGSVTVTAHQTGNSSWEPAADVSKTFTILEHSITTNPSASGITYEQTLASSTLSGGVASVAGTWSWNDSSIEPNAGTTSYIAVFTPDNTSGAFTASDTLHCNVSVTTAKATPDISCDIDDEYEIGHSNLDLQTLWTREGDGTITYSKVSFVASGENNDGATEPVIKADGYTLTLGQAGALTIQMAIAAGTNYNARTVTKEITIYKKANAVFAEGVADYSSEMYMNSTHADIELTATNTNYSGEYGSAIGVRQLNMKNDSVTYTYNASTRKLSVSSSYYTGTVYFEISQQENYKYLAAKDTFGVEVKLQPAATNCYVYTNTSTEYGIYASGFPISYNIDGESQSGYRGDGDPMFSLSSPGEKLYFNAKHGGGIFDGDKLRVLYTTDNGASLKFLKEFTLTSSYTTYNCAIPEGATDICFYVKYGETGTKYYRDIYVTRKTWLKSDTLRISKTAGNNPIYPSSGVGVGTLVVDYALASGGDLHIENDNPEKFTLSRSTVTGVNCTTDTAHVLVSYSSAVAGNDTAHIVIYNDAYRTSTIITGTTVKHNQVGRWKDNISTVKIGTEIINAYTSTLSDDKTVEYSRLSGSSITIEDGTLIAYAEGTSRIRAFVDSSALYNQIADTIDIRVTTDEIQYIVWGEGLAQTLRRLTTDDETVTISATAQSDVEECTTNGSRPITFASRNASVVSVNNETKKLTVVGKGRTWLVASQAGGDDEEEDEEHKHNDYLPVSDSLLVIVRNPNDLCPEYYLYNFNDSTIVRSETIMGEEGANFVGGKSGLSNTIRTLTTGTFSHAPAYAKWCYKRSEKGAGSITLQQYIPGTGWETVGTPRTSFTETWAKDSVPVSRGATRIQVVPSESTSYLYIGSFKVGMASYVEVVENEAITETLVFSGKIGSNSEKEVTVRWYHDQDLRVEMEDGAPFRLKLNEDDEESVDKILDADCRIDTVPSFTIIYEPLKAEADEEYTLTFTDGKEGGFRKTITLKASADAEIVEFQTSGSWTTASNWKSSATPNQYRVASIADGKEVTISTEVVAYGLTIGSGSKVTILPTGGLKVGVGGISGASATSLILETDDDTETPSSTLGQTGYLRISPDYVGDMPSATVKLFSKAYSNDAVYNWQYVGIPLGDDNVYGWDICTYGQQYIYGWNEEAGDWFDAFEERVYPFQGYCLTQENNSKGRTFTFTGTLAAPSSTLEPISLSYTSAMADGVKGYHVLANSFAAPIDISRFDVEDFVNATATIYLFNTGYYEKGGSGGIVDVDKWEKANAGQYIAIPVETANTVREVEASFPVVIPAMQGFCVQATGADATLKLDYNELVWKADYSKHPNKPMRVAAQKTEEQEETNESDLTDFIKVTLSDGEAADNLYLLASASYDKSYENGYDAPKMMSDDPALPNIFAVEDDGQFAIDATSDIEGTFIGVRTGAASNYTIYFSHVNAETEWMLLDIQENKKTRIANEASYSFSAKANSLLTNRFVIVEWDGNAGTATGTEETTIQNKIQKFIYNDQLFILKDGVLYDARGMVVHR